MPFPINQASDAPGILVSFYLGDRPDDRGRYINEIHGWDYDRLEYIHDYIQWLFPLKESSSFNPGAPVLDETQIKIFRSNETLRTHLIRSIKMMLSFYGLKSEENTQALTIRKSPEYSERKLVWLSYGNHNYLRITRILTSLRLLGLDHYALEFFRILDQIYKEEKEKIGSITYDYWKQAVS